MVTHPQLVPLADRLSDAHHDVLDSLNGPRSLTVDDLVADTGRTEGECLRLIRGLRRHGFARCVALQLTDTTDECWAATQRGRQMLATLRDLGRQIGV